MGFSASMLVLFPRTYSVFEERPEDTSLFMRPRKEYLKILSSRPRKKYTVWEAEQNIDFGGITRVDKVTDKTRYPHQGYAEVTLAGICCFDWIYRKLIKRSIRLGWSRDCFAPPFTISAAPGLQHLNDWREERISFKKLRGGEMFVQPRYRLDYTQTRTPAVEILKCHNETLSLSDDALSHHGKNKYSVINDVPLMWISARTLARWIREFEKSKTLSWQELQKVPSALARVRAWQAYLREVGKVDARVLFYFPQ